MTDNKPLRNPADRPATEPRPKREALLLNYLRGNPVPRTPGEDR